MDLVYEGMYLYDPTTSSSEAAISKKVEDVFPDTDSPVWILGKEYTAKHEMEELESEILSRLWFSYRRDFPEIGESGYTTDRGWGCMLRCGQMVLGEALQRLNLGRSWRWPPPVSESTEKLEKYLRILRLFEDSKSSVYSIHQISLMGESEDTRSKRSVGTWFGPNTVAQVIRKLAAYEESNPINVYVALDNTLILDEIKSHCSDSDSWNPLLLFIPLRLGLTEINNIYFQDLKDCFEFSQCVGVIGGRPNHALFFIGYVEDELIFLDPHTTTQSAAEKVKSVNDDVDRSFHTSKASRIDISQLDPSLSLCFLCENEANFDELCQSFLSKLIRGHTSPLFEICRERPEHLKDKDQGHIPDLRPDESTGKDYEQIRRFDYEDDDDDDFEIL